MKNIIKSLVIVVAVAAVASVATWAVFSSTATVDNNSFATGTIEIRVNGQPSIVGFNVDNAVPGDCATGNFGINNYGLPWFSDISTLDAKELVMNIENETGDLCSYLDLKVEANRGWPSRMGVYDADLSSAPEMNLLSPRWSDLIVGSSEDVYYEVCLPADAPNDAQGKSCQFDFAVTGYNPVRP